MCEHCCFQEPRHYIPYIIQNIIWIVVSFLCVNQLCSASNQLSTLPCPFMSLGWRHDDHHGVSDHRHHDCLLNCLFRRRSKKTSKLRVTGLCVWNSPLTSDFPAQMASNAENVSIWWRHQVFVVYMGNQIELLASYWKSLIWLIQVIYFNYSYGMLPRALAAYQEFRFIFVQLLYKRLANTWIKDMEINAAFTFINSMHERRFYHVWKTKTLQI